MPLTRAILEGENPWTIARIANTMKAMHFMLKVSWISVKIQEKRNGVERLKKEKEVNDSL